MQQEFLPIPLQQQQQFLDPEEKFLDLADLYTVYKTLEISSLFPDSATKMVTKVYKEGILFELVADQIYDRTGKKVYLLEKKDGFISKRIYDPEDREFKNSKKPKLANGTPVIISIDEVDFGHFCGAYYEDETIFMYDSMMRYEKSQRVSSDYVPKFVVILSETFKLSRDQKFVCDYFHDDESKIPLEFYSFEITGGALDTKNMYAEAIKAQPVDFMVNSIIMGPDNQNQYCWMWTMLYLLIKVSGNSWHDFQRKVWERDIIPVSLIKLFLSLVVKVDNFPVLVGNSKSARFFKLYFNTVMSNYPTYREIFNPSHSNFELYENVIGSAILNNDSHLTDYFQCVEFLIKILNQEQIVLQKIRPRNNPILVQKILGLINQHREVKKWIESFGETSIDKREYKGWFVHFTNTRELKEKVLQQQKLVTRQTLDL
jgi:hypothetical protein